jgi:hypothetical protein
MTLENILLALKHATNDTLSELDEEVLGDKEAREFLTTHFSELETRSKLTATIKTPSILYDYLSLDLKERIELECFRQEYPEYLRGEGTELRTDRRFSENVNDIVKKCRYTEQLTKAFKFYLDEREKDKQREVKELEGVIFGPNYLKTNEKLNKIFPGFGNSLYQKTQKNLSKEGGLRKVVELVSELNPEINAYTTKSALFSIEGPEKLLELFEFYLKNREDGEIFNGHYIKHNALVKESFGNLGSKLYTKARNYFKNEGDLNHLAEIVAQSHPEILEYWQPSRQEKLDCVKQFIEIFDFFRKNSTEGERFNTHYLLTNVSLKEKFGGLGKRVYHQSRNRYDGVNQLVEIAARQRPEILEHWSYEEKGGNTD